MRLETSRFGTQVVGEDAIFTFDEGVLGFPDSHVYALIDSTPRSPFQWLQSADDPTLAFIVTDPCPFHPEYEIDLPDDVMTGLGISAPEEVRILAVVTIRREPREVSLNLAGPLILSLPSRRAAQIVLDGDVWSTRTPLTQERHRAAPRAAAVA